MQKLAQSGKFDSTFIQETEVKSMSCNVTVELFDEHIVAQDVQTIAVTIPKKGDGSSQFCIAFEICSALNVFAGIKSTKSAEQGVK